jgi:hypothetical protein
MAVDISEKSNKVISSYLTSKIRRAVDVVFLLLV